MNHRDDLTASLALLEAYRFDVADKIYLLPLQTRAITETLATIECDAKQTRPITIGDFDKRRHLLRCECSFARRSFTSYLLDGRARIHTDTSLPRCSV